jgi:hypothetical protein
MAKKKKDKSSEFDGILEDGAIDQLQNMVNDMLKLATDVAKDYDLDTEELAELSGSVTYISENSPFLNELFQGEAWKEVMDLGNKFNTKNSGSNETK